MKTRNGLFADVPENLWNDWHWQVANRAETIEDLKKYMTLTPDEEAGVAKTLGKLRMAVTPYYLSLIDLDDPFDPIRKMAIPRAEELEYADLLLHVIDISDPHWLEQAQIVDELIYERTAVEARILRDFAPQCTPEQRALIRRRVEAYAALAATEKPDYNRLYEADRTLHGTWFAAMDKMYLWSTLQNAHADYSRFRMLDTITSGGLAEVIADHRSLLDAIERCDLAAFEPLVEKHLYGGIRRLGSKLTEEYADYFEPEK